MFTRGQIIDGGLDQAGRPDLTSEARLWLNLFLEMVYRDQDFDWLVKTDSSIATTNGTAFPSDYRAAKSAFIENHRLDITSNHDEWVEMKKRFSSSTGTPRVVLADHDLRQFYFLPEGTVTFELRYYYIPTLPDHTDAGTDSQQPKWGLSHQILFDYIKSMAMEYNDDTRQGEALSQAIARVASSKMNNHDRRAGSSRLVRGKSFVKRY